VVSSALYALRTSDKARALLGEEIYFAHKIPWIWGEINQLHGRIDIQFRVKGRKNEGMMKFKSFRPKRMGFVSCALILLKCYTLTISGSLKRRNGAWRHQMGSKLIFWRMVIRSRVQD
jgi:hypothetical protein